MDLFVAVKLKTDRMLLTARQMDWASVLVLKVGQMPHHLPVVLERQKDWVFDPKLMVVQTRLPKSDQRLLPKDSRRDLASVLRLKPVQRLLLAVLRRDLASVPKLTPGQKHRL